MDKGNTKNGNVKKVMIAALLLLSMATAWASSQNHSSLSSNVQAVGRHASGDGIVVMGFPPPVGDGDPTPTPN